MALDVFSRYNDPRLAIKTATESQQADMWTALPGIIQSFDSSAMTVTVQPSIQALYTGGNLGQEFHNLPILQDVPVVFPRGGDYTMTFPVKSGDECLVVFSSRCIDSWWDQGGVQPQRELRMHDLSDGFAIIGPYSQKTKIDGVSEANAQFRSNDGKLSVELNASAQTVTNSAGTTNMIVDGTANKASINATGLVAIAGATVALTAAQQAIINAPLTSMSGNLHVVGTVTTGGGGGGGGSISPAVFQVNGTTSADAQTATTNCHNSGGGIVYFPAANYTIDTSIDCRGMSNITFKGDGPSTVLIATAALNGSNAETKNAVFNANNLTTIFPNYPANLTFSDMTIDCTAQNASGVPPSATAGYNLCAIECQNVNNAQFERLIIINAFGNGVVSGSIDPQLPAAVAAARVNNCTFIGCVTGILPQYGITGSVVQYGAMQGGSIERSRFFQCGGPAIDVFNCFGTVIRDNYFIGEKGTPHGVGQTISSIHSDFGLQQCTIEGNVFLEAGPLYLSGIMAVTPFNVVPTPGPQSCIIRGNKFYGAATSNNAFSHITMNGGSGTTLGNAYTNLIDGNMSYQAPKDGMTFIDGLLNIVVNNIIDQCGHVSIGTPFVLMDSGASGGGSKENRFQGNEIVLGTILANLSDNGANNISNHFWDNRMETTTGGPSTLTTASLDKNRNYGPGSP